MAGCASTPQVLVADARDLEALSRVARTTVVASFVGPHAPLGGGVDPQLRAANA